MGMKNSVLSFVFVHSYSPFTFTFPVFFLLSLELHVSIDQNEGKSNSGLNGDPESVSDEVDCSNRLTKVVSSTDLMVNSPFLFF